jgi:hypothetical protein
MKKSDFLKSVEDRSGEIMLSFCPISESVDEFQKRKSEVQAMLAKIFILAKKRGRPSTTEEFYEEAA